MTHSSVSFVAGDYLVPREWDYTQLAVTEKCKKVKASFDSAGISHIHGHLGLGLNAAQRSPEQNDK